MKKVILFVLFAWAFTFAVPHEAIAQQASSQEDLLFEEFEDEFKEVDEVFDPLRGYNKVMTNFNDGFYINILMPVSKGYENVVHENIRTGVSNVFDNLFSPIRFINNILQFKFANASEELGRFVINSTFGLLGIMDVAKKFDLEPHKEDFGQTLGYYGIGSGFHVVLPFLGPSNIRDIIGLTTDSHVNVLSTNVAYDAYQIPNNTLEQVGYKSFDVVNTQSFNPTAYENLKKQAVDLYPFLRDIYEQRRKTLIEE
jgi:phospholipid-binding lipoprotein MlaA